MKFKNVTTAFSYLPEGTPGGQGGSAVTANPVQTGNEQLLNTLTINGVNYLVGGMEVYEPVVSPTPSANFLTAGSPVTSMGYGIQKDGNYEGLKNSLKAAILARGGTTETYENMFVTSVQYQEENYSYQVALVESDTAETILSSWANSSANVPENAFMATDSSTWLYQEMATAVQSSGSEEPDPQPQEPEEPSSPSSVLLGDAILAYMSNDENADSDCYTYAKEQIGNIDGSSTESRYEKEDSSYTYYNTKSGYKDENGTYVAKARLYDAGYESAAQSYYNNQLSQGRYALIKGNFVFTEWYNK